MPGRMLFSSALWLIAVAFVEDATAQQYTIQELPGPAEAVSTAIDINNNGQVVGNAQINESGLKHALLWNDGQPTDIDPTGEFGSTACITTPPAQNAWAFVVMHALQP